MSTQKQKRTRQQKIEATQKRAGLAPSQQVGVSYTFQGKKTAATSPTTLTSLPVAPTRSIFQYDHRLIYKDLLRTVITTLFIFGILIGVWQYLT